MARKAKPYEEARKDAEAFFRGDNLRTEVFLSRYALRALDGNWLETTPDGMADCLAELNLVYGSGPSLSALDRLMGAIKEAAYGESIRLAEEKGPFPAFDPVRHLESPYVRAEAAAPLGMCTFCEVPVPEESAAPDR